MYHPGATAETRSDDGVTNSQWHQRTEGWMVR